MTEAAPKKKRGGQVGHPVSSAARAKLSAAHLGKKLSPEHIRRMSDGLKGHSVSKETKAKISAALTGRPLSLERRAQMSAVRLGKPRPDIAALLRGRKFTPERLAKGKLTALRGEAHWNWQGGTPVAISKSYTNHRWKVLRRRIVERDDYTCQNCGKRITEKGKLHVHHIRPYKTSLDNREENLMTLCIWCHKRFFDLK